MRGGRTRSFDISGPIGLSFSLKRVTTRRPVFYGRLSRLGPTPLKVMPLVPSQAARPRSGSQQARMNPRGKLKACPSVPSMGRILLDERSQPEPMAATVVNRKA